jgi:hypothetical protein
LFRDVDAAYAVPIERVVEIVPLHNLTRVPQSPSRVLGLVALRRQMIPVVAPAERSHKGESIEADSTAAAILVVRTTHGMLGLVIQREETCVAEAQPEKGGTSTTGTQFSVITRGTNVHSAVEVDALWLELRKTIERCYGTVCKP